MAAILVGIPTRDRPHYLPLALASVLGQSLRELRVSIADDASAPESSRAVAEHVAGLGDARVERVRHDFPKLEYGQGRWLFSRLRDEEFFVILHDDDLLDPRCLERAVSTLRAHPDLDAWFADPWILDAAGARTPGREPAYRAEHGRDRLPPGPVGILHPLLAHGAIPISGTVFRVSALRASGFVTPEIEGNFPFEFDLLLRLGAQGRRAFHETEPLVGFRLHGASLRAGLWRDPVIVANFVRVLEQHRFSGADERLRRRLLGSRLRRRAELQLLDGDLAAARADLARATAAWPASWKSWALRVATRVAPGATRAAALARRGRPA